KGEKINSLPIEERVKLGLGIMYQYPPKIKGVKLEQIARFLCKDDEKIKKLSKLLSLEEHLKREINVGFSGGETKRAELFQLLLQEPQLFTYG
ncbi:MAG: ABC transporter ATP-binding protein, partial [Candidatus Aenigmatarchaeota archaeon]